MISKISNGLISDYESGRTNPDKKFMSDSDKNPQEKPVPAEPQKPPPPVRTTDESGINTFTHKDDEKKDTKK